MVDCGWPGNTQTRGMATTAGDTAVDPRCVEWCRSKVKLLSDDVDGMWVPEVRLREGIPDEGLSMSHGFSDGGVSR